MQNAVKQFFVAFMPHRVCHPLAQTLLLTTHTVSVSALLCEFDDDCSSKGCLPPLADRHGRSGGSYIATLRPFG